MAETREVKGTLTEWHEIREGISEDRKTPWAFVVFYLDNEDFGHKLFSGNREALLEMIQTCPVGSIVEFKEKQKGNFWNIVEGSFKVVRKVEKFVKGALSLKIIKGIDSFEFEEEYGQFAKTHNVKFSQTHILSNGQAVFYCVFVYYKGD